MRQLVTKTVLAFINTYNTNSSDALLTALDLLIRPESLRRLLTLIQADSQLQSDIVRHSYLHSNGFLKLTLASTPTFQLRLHIWDTRDGGLPYTPETIHNHSADFASVLLTGGYRHEVYIDAHDAQEYGEYAYHGARGARTFSLKRSGIRRLRLISTEYLTAGTAYNLAADVLHRVIPFDNHLTVSLVLKGAISNNDITVCSNEAIPEGAAIEVIPLQSHYLTKYCKELQGMSDTLSGSIALPH